MLSLILHYAFIMDKLKPFLFSYPVPLKIGLVCLLLFNLAGCMTTKVVKTPHPQFPAVEKNPEVRLGSGDELDIKFRYWPELDNNLRVRPDGYISLQMIDDVYVDGMTPMELDVHLTEVYKKWLKEPTLTVVVRFLNRQRVYVNGAVRNQGVVGLKGNMTLVEAIGEIGGWTKDAELSNVVVLRHSPKDNKRYATTVNVKDMLAKQSSEPFYLAAQDVIYVPQTRIVQLNQWIVQHINGMVPKFGVSATFPRPNMVITVGDR